MNTLFCLDTRLYKSDREIVIARRHRYSVVWRYCFSPPDPPTHEFLSPVRNPPRLPTPFPSSSSLPPFFRLLLGRALRAFPRLADRESPVVNHLLLYLSLSLSLLCKPLDSRFSKANRTESNRRAGDPPSRGFHPVRLVSAAMANTDELSVVKFSFHYV